MRNPEMNQQEILGKLRQLRIEIDMLKARVAENSEKQDTKLHRYLETLDEKTDEVDKTLTSLKDKGEEAMDDLARGLKEAVGRLEIAKRATQARFH